MQLRNQVEWALHCCTLLARVPAGGHLATRDLAEFHGVPKEYLSKALQALSGAGIVESTLGPSGGYRLARPLEDITFLDIVEAVEGRRSTFQCTEIRACNPCLPKGARVTGTCPIARAMWDADEAWRASLRGVRLSDMSATLDRTLDAELRSRISGWVEERS